MRNLEASRESVRAHKQRRKRLLNLLKGGRPCYDCGGMFSPECMDWDHRPDTVKVFNISDCDIHTLDAAIEEINKCDLVCACCHRIRTKARINAVLKPDLKICPTLLLLDSTKSPECLKR